MTSNPGVHSGQVLTAQVGAAVALAVGGPAAAAVTAAALLAGAFVRFRHRWLHQWLGTAVAFATRRRRLPAGADATALLRLVAPGIRWYAAEVDGQPTALLTDGHGLAAMLELTDPVTPHVPLPAPDASGNSLQWVITGVRGTAGALTARQAVLTVRVPRADGLTLDDLRHRLSAAVRTVRRRLAPLPATLLGPEAASQVVAELAHHDGARPGREDWSGVHLGGLIQVTYRMPAVAALLPRLLVLPAVATTISQHGAELTVRLATGSVADARGAEAELRRLLARESVPVHRLDGEHRAGLAATLPLGTAAVGWDGELHLGESGLPLGVDRHGEPVLVALFRPTPTRAVLLGEPATARILAVRAAQAGAQVVVRTGQPDRWRCDVAGVRVAGPREDLPAAGQPRRPLLRVLDSRVDAPPGRWCADLVVGTATDPDRTDLSRADLVLTQSLPEAAATFVSATLGLGRSGRWLRGTGPGLVGVINRRVVRWALLSPTPWERQVLSPARTR